MTDSSLSIGYTRSRRLRTILRRKEGVIYVRIQRTVYDGYDENKEESTMTEFNRCIECNERPTWYHGAHFCKACAIAFYNAVDGVFNGSRANTLVEDKKVTGTQYVRFRDDYKRLEDEGMRNEHVMAEEELTDIERRVEEARQDGEGVGELALVDIPKLLAEIERWNRLHGEVLEIGRNIEIDRNTTEIEYREYVERTDAEIDRYREALEEIARGRFPGASYKARQTLESDNK